MTSNTMVVYEKVADPIRFTQNYKLAVASIVGCSLESAEGIALVCMCEGLTFMEFRNRYHWIPGKGPSMRASSMLSEFRMNYGGQYTIVENSSKAAAITFTDRDGKIYPLRLDVRSLMLSRNPWRKDPGWQASVAEVRKRIKAGESDDTIFEAMLPQMGDNYGTEYDWQNMLMARLTSQSLRVICPELTAGVYTPEEMEDLDVTGTSITTAAPPKKTGIQVVEEAAARESDKSPEATSGATTNPAASTAKLPDEPHVFDAEYTEATAEQAPDVTSTLPGNPPVVSEPDLFAGTVQEGYATSAQVAKIRELFNVIGATYEQQCDILARRNAATVHSLPVVQAAEIIDRLEAAKAQRPPR